MRVYHALNGKETRVVRSPLRTLEVAVGRILFVVIYSMAKGLCQALANGCNGGILLSGYAGPRTKNTAKYQKR